MSLPSIGRVRTRHLQAAKRDGDKITVLTSYDTMTARIFDEAGIDVLLVGDSAANVVYGRDTTVSLTINEMITMARAVAHSAKRSLVVADMTFGSYEASDIDAVHNAMRLMKEAGVAAVKLEGGTRRARTIRALVDAGIPVMGHIGFTPQSIHSLGGTVVQGRGDAAEKLIEDGLAVQEAGAFSVVVEMCPAEVGTRLSEALDIPVIGIGAGNGTDGQVLVWTDPFGFSPDGFAPSFARKYLDLGAQLRVAAGEYARDVREGTFPAADESFDR
ncbi:3-methyl-2-oxobutanoate hydroxymethyltransferase [Corynebacterium guangdongense]|uniref:3-methyl-2-oxobutanoate hydroxymethyltransferase n=1 Tax=Corynebacterium guangdongense TaxID=1783348 RepID=A0ABU1ZWK4_9CORY|nr:3-methyl-2-oxobutanoate hydroxymethyltransferase [Corynebacterium guangdongense]MDR7329319.1 3-methyl-2-oxobutanoate hydroxymethyltransferase [Corynebacterium guangdongense]WJZ17885.1 3-methyl-2-oxobutanoate hydroxymethyltransferase [Corynebacterium guangdongense]